MMVLGTITLDDLARDFNLTGENMRKLSQMIKDAQTEADVDAVLTFLNDLECLRSLDDLDTGNY